MNAPTEKSTPTDLATLRNPSMAPDVHIDFFSKNGFDLACRIAKAFSTSDAVPAIFRQYNEKKEKGGGVTWVENPNAIGNCLVAIEVANAVGMSMVSVMQNADIIQGKLRWTSKFQIGAINASRRFSPLKFKLTNLGRIKAKYKEKTNWNPEIKKYNFVEHEVEMDNWECVAWAYELDINRQPTKEVVQSIPITMKMAVEEGWYAKDGSKWQGEMRFQMLQYRAGTFFGSIYAPDVIMGMGKSIEEERDIIDVTQQADGVFAASASTLQELRTGADVGNMPKDVGQDTPETGVASGQTESKASGSPAGDVKPEDAGASGQGGVAQDAQGSASSTTSAQSSQQDPGAPVVTFEQVWAGLSGARNEDEVAVAGDLIQYVPELDRREQLNNFFSRRRSDFKAPADAKPAQSRRSRPTGKTE